MSRSAASLMCMLCLVSTGKLAPAEAEFVRVAPGGRGFVVGDKPWLPFGCNYYDPHVGWAPKLWREFDPVRVEKHFRVMKDLGVDVVRIFLTAQSFFPNPPEIEPSALKKWDALLDIARRHGIRVHPTGPDHWEGVPDWRRGDIFTDPEALKAQVAFWKSFCARYRGEPAIFAYDLLNEPHVRWDGPGMEALWRKWLRDRHGTIDGLRRAWGVRAAGIESFDAARIPPDEPSADSAELRDFQEFRESVAERWVKVQVDAIREAGDSHLVTVGLIQWSVPVRIDGRPSRYAAFEPGRLSKHVDFPSIHFYPLYGDPLSGEEGMENDLAYLEFVLRYVQGLSPGKPLLVGEFGWYGGGKPDGQVERPAEDQVRWCRAAVLQGTGIAAGWLNWAYADTPSSRDMSKFSGLFTEDDTPKPWGIAFRELALHPESWTRPMPAPRARFEFQRGKAVVDPRRGDEDLRRYAELWRKEKGALLEVKP